MTVGSAEWYWCLNHGRAEAGDEACAAQHRLGPYSSREDAENWKQRVEARNERWDAEDRAWKGEDDG